jgi:hypothetical protein
MFPRSRDADAKNLPSLGGMLKYVVFCQAMLSSIEPRRTSRLYRYCQLRRRTDRA